MTSKKKIGVLTSYFATNFGAALQCYALKSVLEKMGYDVDYIRYKQPALYKRFYPFYWKNISGRSPKEMFVNLCHISVKYKKWKVFEKFRLLYIQPQIDYQKNIPKDKDFYILGSDQIWNPYITKGFDDVFWGRFEHKKNAKVFSYATSTENMHYSNSDKAYIRDAICQLNHVSVREEQFKKELTEISGRDDITTVLDPTLLADKSIYEAIITKRPIEDRFVLFYKIRKCSPFITKINQFAISIGARLLILSSGIEDELNNIAKKDENIIYQPLAGVETFLGAIKYADYIFTPSFHGTAFAVIFNKRFYTLVLDDDWNNRTKDLLDKLGLSDRRLFSSGAIVGEAPDYKTANVRLMRLREESHSFLASALN